MGRGHWVLVTLCLVVSACAAPPPVTVSVPAEREPAADGGAREEDIDRMVAIIRVPLSTDADSTPSPARPSGPIGAARSVGSATALNAATPAVTSAPAVLAPPPPTSTPRPAPTAAPKATSPAPTSVPGCAVSQAITDGDATVRAAQAPPALFYGGGLCAGDKVEALIAGTSCGVATVNAVGQWSMAIRSGAPCAPTEGAAVTLTVNGKAATVSPPVQWRSGGLPPDVANGYTLPR